MTSDIAHIKECTCSCLCKQRSGDCHFSPFECIPCIGPNTEYEYTIVGDLKLPINGIEISDADRFFCHFITIMPSVLALPWDLTNATIIPVTVPMSLKDEMILKSMLCVGASHYMNYLPPDTTETDRLSSVKFRLLREADQELSSRLAAQDSKGKMAQREGVQEALFASSLLLYLYEVSEGTGDGSWQVQLERARNILFKDAEGCSGELEFAFHPVLVQYLIHCDILGRVTNHQTNYRCLSNMLGPEWRSMAENNGLLGFIARISSLRSDAMGKPGPSAAVIAQAVGIWQDIDNWSHCDPCDHLVYQSHAAACFIWLFFILYPDKIADEKVQQTVRQCLGSLSSTPMVGSSLIFPLFVFGMACIERQDRKVLEEQLDKIQDSCRLGNIRVCKQIILKSWKSYDAGQNQSWDWMHLMEADGVSVPIV